MQSWKERSAGSMQAACRALCTAPSSQGGQHARPSAAVSMCIAPCGTGHSLGPVSYTHLRAHETSAHL
eukprot:12599135-Alexandrium_andersonii.AAC.1